ncbi:hypothetical protein DFH07DRAFT_689725, partial [Mycena maculata]
MARTPASGGGAPSRAWIAKELFSDEVQWCDLTDKDQRMVIRRQVSLQKWKVGRSVGAVFSTDCHCDILTLEGNDPEPCSACQKLLSLHAFQVAIRCQIPDDKKMKFVPKAYRDPDLGQIYLKYHGVWDLVEQVSEDLPDDGQSPYLKFAQRCADGTYKSEMLTGMVQALVLKQKRVDAGKSSRNMKYDSSFDQFC